MVYKKFLVTACSPFEWEIKALQEQFEPESQRDLYLVEF